MNRKDIFAQWDENFQQERRAGAEVPSDVEEARKFIDTLLAVPQESELFGAYLSDVVYLYGRARAKGAEELLGVFLQIGFSLITKKGGEKNVRSSAN